MTAISNPNHRWRVGEVEITRVLEFEAALFEPAVIHPEASPRSCAAPHLARAAVNGPSQRSARLRVSQHGWPAWRSWPRARTSPSNLAAC